MIFFNYTCGTCSTAYRETISCTYKRRDATTSVILSGIYCKSKSYLSFYYMVYCIQLSKFE